MTKAPLPDSVRIGKVSLAVFQTVTFFLKSNPFSGICIDCVCRTLLYRHVQHARTPVRVSSEWWCRWDGGGNSLCCLYGNRGPSRAKFINCSRILPCGTIYLLHLRCDWTYTRQSNAYGQVASIFNVTNWLSPLKLRKICNLTKFFRTLILLKINKIAFSIRPYHPL